MAQRFVDMTQLSDWDENSLIAVQRDIGGQWLNRKMPLSMIDARMQGRFGVSTGSANAYILTLSPAPTAYVAGQVFEVKANHTNDGAPTLDVNALGAKSMKRLDGTAIPASFIVSGRIYKAIYDGIDFILPELPLAGATLGFHFGSLLDPYQTSNTSPTSIGLGTGAITIGSVSDRFRVVASLGALSHSNDANTCFARITRILNGTPEMIWVGNAAGARTRTHSAINLTPANRAAPIIMQLLETPGVVGTIDYYVQVWSTGGTVGVNVLQNDGDANNYPRAISTIVAERIAG